MFAAVCAHDVARRQLSRTYATAIAGAPVSMSFNPTTAHFTLLYASSASVKSGATTEIYLNEAFYYPQGFYVTFAPLGVASYTKTHNRVEITHTAAFATLQVDVWPI